MSIFDLDTFLDASTSEAGTKRPPLPAGESFVGVIGDIKPPRETAGKQDPSKSYIFLDIPVKFDLTSRPDIAALVGTTEVTLVAGVSLDLIVKDGRTALDTSPGKNRGLTKWREAVGLNQDGVTFSPRMLTGRMVLCKIKHDPYQGDVYDKLDSVAKVS